jgi:hypothetical protein
MNTHTLSRYLPHDLCLGSTLIYLGFRTLLAPHTEHGQVWVLSWVPSWTGKCWLLISKAPWDLPLPTWPGWCHRSHIWPYERRPLAVFLLRCSPANPSKCVHCHTSGPEVPTCPYPRVLSVSGLEEGLFLDILGLPSG